MKKRQPPPPLGRDEIISAMRYLGYVTHDEQGQLTEEAYHVAAKMAGKYQEDVMLGTWIATEVANYRKIATCMHHLTLLTGHTRESPRSEVADHVIKIMRPWLAPGTHRLAQVRGGYSLVVPAIERGYVATVQQGRVPIASIGVAADESEADYIWPALVELQRAVAEPAATRPATTPWCAVALLVVAPATSDWLGDFERCLAWTYLEDRK